ncbi:MAG TPA: efflux RND transporter periplasmic adaptor subunit [Bacteroidales bacterium]|nr:efflux RND transporter periplasmic adaptor subunit [Bacteroidales bacterium]
MKKLGFIAFMLIGVLVVFMSSCRNGSNSVAEIIEVEYIPEDIVELRDDQIKLAGIQMGAIEIRSLGNSLKVNGIVTVTPQNIATVCMPLGGFIKTTTLMPGNAVSKGQSLAVIVNQEFVDIQLDYLEAKNKLSYAKAEYERHTDLFKDDVYSEKNVQQVTVEYKNLIAMVKSLEQKLLLIGINPDLLREDNINSEITLVSPIKGFIKSININIGKYVSPTDVLFEIINSDILFLELTLFEKDAEKVTLGQKIRFFVNNGSKEYEAVITQTGKSVSSDKTFTVYASVTGQCNNVLPGMYVNAYIEESGNMVTSLPSEAIVSFDDRDYIFTFEKDKLEDGKPFTEYRMVEVKKGISGSGFTEVELPEGFNISTVKVVIKGAYNLLSAKKNAGEMAC